ncbi:hypothetical protein QTG54_001481 [Skeletonema marinoi]|uniref:Uncharacterized protein n=1 Tax=Skeletonema marinoi TaxID=267567 RepID=A0AAD8YJK1_9STRA|nr:hypothetical protein QTG54_001481 [Skeletonema marinoi]
MTLRTILLHTTSATGMSLCQMNNHPDFRLRVAKQKFGGGGANITVKQQPATASNNKRDFSSKSVPNYKKQVREGGLNIHLLENPVDRMTVRPVEL